MKRNKRILSFFTAVLIIMIAAAVSVSGVSAAGYAAEADEAPAAVGAVKPEIKSIMPTAEGVRISWGKIDGVSAYRLDRYYTDGRGWVMLKKTTLLSYVDTNVSSGSTYEYRIMGVNSAGTVVTPSVSASFTYIAPPKVTSAEVISEGIKVTWSKPAGMSSAALLRKTDGGEWQRIRVTSASSYVDKSASGAHVYTYTVRALDASGEYVYDFFDETGVSVRRLDAPKLSVSCAAGGVEVSWKAVDGAEAYRVYIKKNNSWSALGDTKAASYTDASAVSGTVCTYTVRCVSADGKALTSYYDTEGKSVYYVAAPKLRAADSTNSGVQISWERSEGAAYYRVFYKNSGGGWSRLGDTYSTSMVDEDVRAGSTYTYTVRCVASDGSYCSWFYTDGVSVTYLTAPVISSLSSGERGVDISWTPVPGAEKYRVYYYGSKGWTRLTDTSGTSFTDTDVSSGYTYTYTVRCINEEGTAFTSGFLSGRSVYYIAAPVISGFTNTEDGVKISWGAVRGAQKYRVYYYGSRGWTRMTDTTSTSYLDDDVASGYTYTYTVRCINSDGTAFMSYFLPGVKHTFISAPDFSLSRAVDGITVSWNAVRGAQKYRVYRYGADGWTKLTDTSATSVTDKDIRSGGTYKYTVRCLSADGSKAISDFYAGKSLKFVKAPKISSVSNTTQGVSVRWNTVEGAQKYRVYHKTGDGGWTRLTDTASDSFVDTSVGSGNVYDYTVRCINAAGNAFESGFYEDGASIRYIASPKKLRAECEGNSVRISWDESEGAAKYRVYYYGNGGWTRFAETSDTHVTDKDVVSGTVYKYTVRCVSADGKSFTSDFDRDGVSCDYHIMPVLNTPENTKDGIDISWKESPGAAKYRVYYYGRKGWTKLTETTGTSVTDTDVASGHTYRYTVRCVSADGRSFTSDCDTKGVSVFYVAAPKAVDSSSTAKSITFTWTKSAGAAKYRVYKKVNGSWSRLTETESNSYTDKGLTLGSTYTYTVRCLGSDGSFVSGFDPYGFVFTVSGANFVYYDQGQYDYPYGDDTIAYSGCGPTCFAMVASTITGRTITPVDAVAWCGNKYYLAGVGTYWSYFDAAANHFGIKCEGRTESIDEAIAALKKGKYVINSQKAGRFTSGGHFIALGGVDADGKILVYDPNWGRYVGTPFTREEVNESATSFWIFDEL